MSNPSSTPVHDDLTPPVLQVRDLSVSFKTEQGRVQVVKNLNLDVYAGQTLAVVGESGSGKSVTSLALMRLVETGGGQIDSGSMLLRGRHAGTIDLAKATPAQMRQVRGADMAMVFQEPMTSLNPVFTVGEQIAESIRLHQGKSNNAAMAEALRMMELVRIPEARNVLTRHPHQLSGGMRQRVMIAMALSCKPSLLIADEPTTALDVTIQAQILALVQELQREMSMGVIFITHDMGVVAEVADRVLVMYRGDKVEEQDCVQLFANPQQTYTRNLLAAVPQLGAMRGKDLPERFSLLGQSTQAEAPAPQPSTVQAGEPVLQVNKLVTRFPIKEGLFGGVKRQVYAVEQVSLSLHPGETLAVVGESGCGKSTLGRMAAGLLPPSDGEVRFSGKPLAALTPAERHAERLRIQMIFQDPYASLNPRLRVDEIVGEAARIHGLVDQAGFDDYVCAQMERAGLDPALRSRYPHQFSGGQRQRIGIARALAVQPRMLVCDEAVAALDVSIQAQILNLFMDLREQLHLTYLFISHDLGVVEHICDRVVVMYLGRVIETAPVEELFARPNHPYTQALLAEVPNMNARHKTYSAIQGEIPSPLNPPSGCHFHPRCPRAMPRCTVEAPQLKGTAIQHQSACHLNDA